MMRLAFITDLHIGPPHADTYGVDVRRNFLDILQQIDQWQPDALIIGGDLCFREPHAAIYEWIQSQLASRPYPTYPIAGNHDDASMMVQIMQLHSESAQELFYRRDFAQWPALFLDTSKATCSEEQYVWIEQQLHTMQEGIIFLHHPPFPAGVPYMDINHAFRQMERIQSLVLTHQYPLYLFCGHYHVSLSIHRAPVHLHITPSLFFQIRRDQEDFGVDHYRIGFRQIELGTGWLRHELRNSPGNRLISS